MSAEALESEWLSQLRDILPAEPVQRYAVFAHTDNVSNIGRTWQQIWRNWLPESGFEDAHTPPFELYDEHFDPVTGEGGLEVWFPVREVKERDEKTTQ